LPPPDFGPVCSLGWREAPAPSVNGLAWFQCGKTAEFFAEIGFHIPRKNAEFFATPRGRAVNDRNKRVKIFSSSESVYIQK
jgi:hypothetical protein